MLQTIQPATTAPSEAATVTKAVIAAADRLGVSARQLSGILGLSEASVSRMKKRDFQLERGTKPFELALIFIRLFRSLDAITVATRRWRANGCEAPTRLSPPCRWTKSARFPG